MRFGTLTISALISTLSSFAQPDLSLVRFKDEDLLFDLDSSRRVKAVYTGREPHLLIYRIINKSTERIELEFTRESDSSFYFTSYYPSGKQKVSGTLLIDLNWFDSFTLQVPDWKKDPDGAIGIMKDTIVHEYNLRKIEYWWEHDSAGNVWAGGYGTNGKTGKWFFGFFLNNNIHGSYFVRTKEQFYDDGQPNPATIVEYNSISWPKIKGKWVFSEDYSNRSLDLLTRESLNSQRTPYFKFISETKFEYTYYGHGGTTRVGDWWTIGDRLFLKIGRSTQEYKIISSTQSELVIQRVAVHSPIHNDFL